ncbi:RNA polymerase sigma factor [Eggerthella sinensis]|uniref:RNA polymerase sigma factor n=1 Tax=Eggerthella sinensis TaxID=242230 RepID=UPI003F5A7A5F
MGRIADTVALEGAMERWGDTVLRLAVSRMGNAADAEDVFQTVFMRLLQAGEAFEDDDHLKAWLLRVTINCCNDVHRSPWRKRRAELSDATAATLRASALDEPGCEPDDVFAARDLDRDDLAAALARLTDQQRTVVHLFYFEGYATDEIAQITGERPSTVRSHLHRARKALKINLGAHS